MDYSEYDKQVLPPVLLVIVAVAIIIALFLRRKSMRARSVPTALIAIVLLFIEAIKQRWNLRGEFDYFCLPFHYCSLFLIVIPLGELCGKWGRRVFRPIATYMAFIVSAGIYLFPQAILGNACETVGVEFKGTHSFVFHHLIILYFVLTLMLDLYRPRLSDIAKVGAVGLIYAALAIPLTYIFDTNYCNFLSSALEKLEEYRVNNGQVAYTTVIALFLTLGTMVASLLYYVLHKILTAVAYCFGIRPTKDYKLQIST